MTSCHLGLKEDIHYQINGLQNSEVRHKQIFVIYGTKILKYWKQKHSKNSNVANQALGLMTDLTQIAIL